MVSAAPATPAPAQETALERLFWEYELIHSTPLESEVRAILGRDPVTPAVHAMLEPFFPRWKGDASELALPAPPTLPIGGGAALQFDLLDMALHHRDLLEGAVEAMIAALDAVDGDADREAGCEDEGFEADMEPSLSATTGAQWYPIDAYSAAVVDLEEEHDGSEPSLSALTWGAYMLYERDADRRPINVRACDPLDQRRWLSAGEDDREEACDDEGYDGDREPDCDAEPDDAECERNMPEWVPA